MKNTRRLYLFLASKMVILWLLSSCSNVDSTEIDYSFEVAIHPKQSIKEFDKVQFEPFDDLNLGFFKGEVWIKLEIKNQGKANTSYMFVSNDRFNRNYIFYKLDPLDHSLQLVNRVKDTSKKDHRTFNNPNPNLKIDLASYEQATYVIVSTSDGRTKDATPNIISLESYFDFVNENAILNIVFYGIIFCLLLINIYQWNLYKQKIYFYYIFYIASTLLVYLGIEGYFFILRINQIVIDHFVFVSVKLWALSLILYTSKFLEIPTVAPRYYSFIKIVLFVVLGGTLLYQFTFYHSSIQHLHYFENVLSSLWLLLIIGMIAFSARSRRLELTYYLIPLAGFVLFTMIGLIDAHFQVLPGNAFMYVKIGAIVELLGFTYFMRVLIKKKLKKTEALESELLENTKQLKTASEELQEKDRLLSAKTKIKKTDLIGVFKLLENSLSTDAEWDAFKSNFQELNPKFLEHLLVDHPNLSKSEIRLLILTKIGYSQKEIANILGIAPDSVKRAKNRVRKKMNIPETTKLNEFLLKF